MFQNRNVRCARKATRISCRSMGRITESPKPNRLQRAQLHLAKNRHSRHRPHEHGTARTGYENTSLNGIMHYTDAMRHTNDMMPKIATPRNHHTISTTNAQLQPLGLPIALPHAFRATLGADTLKNNSCSYTTRPHSHEKRQSRQQAARAEHLDANDRKSGRGFHAIELRPV